MKVLRHRADVLSTVGSCLIWCAALPASADLVVFDLAWSGASFGNGATATGRFTIDDALLANPGNNSGTTPGLVTALVVTISGASTGNGTYGLADFTNPLSPPSDPVQRRLQGPPAKSKFLAVSWALANPIEKPSCWEFTSDGWLLNHPSDRTGGRKKGGDLFFQLALWDYCEHL